MGGVTTVTIVIVVIIKGELTCHLDSPGSGSA